MLRIYDDDFVPKFRGGNFFWDKKTQAPVFRVHDLRMIEMETYIDVNGHKFLRKMNQLEEAIFRQEFQRGKTAYDVDYIFVTDIKNLVLFLLPTEIMTPEFIDFMFTEVVDRLLHALIIYFEYFLKIMEFIKYRRSEQTAKLRKIQTHESVVSKKILSEELIQYRIMVAREYAEIVLGNNELNKFYHMQPIVNISRTRKDRGFHEGFIAVCTQVVWIAHHRRAYDEIDHEIGRLFRTEHFVLEHSDKLVFTRPDARVLYGKNCRVVNYRRQNSPLIDELKYVSKQNQPLFWIGERKYNGTDMRIIQMEMEFLVPESQLKLLGLAHGILGHPKILYNTELEIDWQAVRAQKYSKEFDPYLLLTQPSLKLPSASEAKIRKMAKRFPYYYDIRKAAMRPDATMIAKWRARDELIHYFQTEGVITNIWMKGMEEGRRTSYGQTPEERMQKWREYNEKRANEMKKFAPPTKPKPSKH